MSGNKAIHKHPKASSKGFKQCPENINKTGANGRSITKIIKDLLSGNIVEVEVTLTDENGIKKEIKSTLNSKDEFAQSIAAILIQKALGGDMAAIKEILDRTEGKPQQAVDHTTGGEKINIIITDKTSDS
jgi:hypothetical protein